MSQGEIMGGRVIERAEHPPASPTRTGCELPRGHGLRGDGETETKDGDEAVESRVAGATYAPSTVFTRATAAGLAQSCAPSIDARTAPALSIR